MKKNYPLKPALITGIISGIFAISAFSLFSGLNDSMHWGANPATIRWLTGVFSILILGIGIYSGMQSIKHKNGNVLSYGQALACGVLVGFTVGISMAVIGIIYTTVINPNYPAYMLAENQKILVSEGKNAAEIAKAQSEMAQMLKPGIQVMQALVLQTGCATIISLIMALFLKTKKS